MIKFLHAADFHLDAPFASLSREAAVQRRQEQREAVKRLVAACNEADCDLMLLAGDLLDSDGAWQETIDCLVEQFGACKAQIFLSPGNHDRFLPGCPYDTVQWPDNVHIFTENRLEAVTLPELDCRVYGAGYQSMDCGALLENFRAEGRERYCVAVLHGDPTQKNSPYCPITASQVRDSGLQYLALGHIHKAGVFRAGATLCAWPGCPMGRGWDETGEKGVCIVTLEESASLRAVALDTLRFHEQTVDIGSDALGALESVLPPAGSRDFYRITLTGSGEVNLAALKQKISNIPNLILRDETLPPLDIWGDTDADTLEGVYFRLLREAMEQSPENREEILLAAELSRKILEGRDIAL